MRVELGPAVMDLSAAHPYFAEKMAKLDEQKIAAAIFSSQYEAVVRRSVGLKLIRKPDDFDLFVDPNHFYEAAEIFGAKVSEPSLKSFTTSDGATVKFVAAEAIAEVGPRHKPDVVQFMLPVGPCRVGEIDYYTGLTSEAAAARAIYKTNEGTLPFANPADTVGMWAMLRREAGKRDLEKAATLLAVGDPLETEYAKERGIHVGWERDPKAQKFISRAAQHARETIAPRLSSLAIPVAA